MTQTIANGATLSGAVNWRAVYDRNGDGSEDDPGKIEFRVDGNLVLTERLIPFGDTPGFWASTSVPDGQHTFQVRATHQHRHPPRQQHHHRHRHQQTHTTATGSDRDRDTDDRQRGNPVRRRQLAGRLRPQRRQGPGRSWVGAIPRRRQGLAERAEHALRRHNRLLELKFDHRRSTHVRGARSQRHRHGIGDQHRQRVGRQYHSAHHRGHDGSLACRAACASCRPPQPASRSPGTPPPTTSPSPATTSTAARARPVRPSRPPLSYDGLTCGTAYQVGVDAYDAAGNRSTRRPRRSRPRACADSQPPTAPTNVTVSTRTTTSIALTWAAATDNVGVAGYGVYNGSRTRQHHHRHHRHRQRPHLRHQLHARRRRVRRVRQQLDQDHRDGLHPPLRRHHPPSQPTNLRTTSAAPTSVTIAWNASTDNVAVAGYDVYRAATKVGTATTTDVHHQRSHLRNHLQRRCQSCRHSRQYLPASDDLDDHVAVRRHPAAHESDRPDDLERVPDRTVARVDSRERQRRGHWLRHLPERGEADVDTDDLLDPDRSGLWHAVHVWCGGIRRRREQVIAGAGERHHDSVRSLFRRGTSSDRRTGLPPGMGRGVQRLQPR